MALQKVFLSVEPEIHEWLQREARTLGIGAPALARLLVSACAAHRGVPDALAALKRGIRDPARLQDGEP